MTATTSLAQAFAHGLEVPSTAQAGEKFPDKFHINNFKPAEGLRGKTFPHSNLPRRGAEEKSLFWPQEEDNRERGRRIFVQKH